MMYARINEDGSVAEFPYSSRDIDMLLSGQELPADMVEVDTQTNKPTIKWDEKVSIDSVVQEGDTYVATYNVPEPKFADHAAKLKSITGIKNLREGENERKFAFRAKALKEDYLEGERDSWDQQRTEAIAYSADETAATPLLSAIATARGITVAELSDKVLANAAAYDAEYGELLGKYQRNRDILNSIDLENPETWDLIDSIVRL
jgi:hypothetical protein